MTEVIFRKTETADVLYVGKRLRKEDQAEVRAMGQEPEQALRYCVAASDESWTAFVEGQPVIIFGWSAGMLSDWGEVWALGTGECTGHPREMLYWGRAFLQKMLEKHPRLENYCDARYTRALRWLKKIGFTVYPPEPYGVKGIPFCRITAERKG